MARIWRPGDDRIAVPEQGILMPSRHERMRRLGKQFADFGGPIMTPNAVAAPPPSGPSLMLHFDGTNGSTTFTDSSSYAHTVTPVGGAVLSTAQFKYGTASGDFTTSGRYLNLPIVTELDITSGDFTLETWIYPTSSGQYKPIYSSANFSVGGPLLCVDNGTLSFLWSPYSNSAGICTGGAITLNAWTFVAVTRKGSTFKCWNAGVGGTAGTSSANATSGYQQQVGTYNSGGGIGGTWAGYIDDLRLTKGTALYTSNFTPPAGPLTP